MALHYNLEKVYELSDGDSDFVNAVLQLFLSEVPADLALIKTGIADENHHQAYSYAHKVKPTLDLLGLNSSFEAVLEIEAWTRREGKSKEIVETFEIVETQVKAAVVEIKSDFNL